MVAWHAMAPERLRANRQLRYAALAIRLCIDKEVQDRELCNPCPPTLLLPISPAAQGAIGAFGRWIVDAQGVLRTGTLPRTELATRCSRTSGFGIWYGRVIFVASFAHEGDHTGFDR